MKTKDHIVAGDVPKSCLDQSAPDSIVTMNDRDAIAAVLSLMTGWPMRVADEGCEFIPLDELPREALIDYCPRPHKD